MNNENNDENEGRFDDEAREACEIAHERECWSRDIEQGIEPAGAEDWHALHNAVEISLRP